MLLGRWGISKTNEMCQQSAGHVVNVMTHHETNEGK